MDKAGEPSLVEAPGAAAILDNNDRRKAAFTGPTVTQATIQLQAGGSGDVAREKPPQIGNSQDAFRRDPPKLEPRPVRYLVQGSKCNAVFRC